MSTRPTRLSSAVRGALSPTLTTQPLSFSQYITQPTAPAPAPPTAADTYKPLTGPDPTGAIAAANQWLAANPYAPAQNAPPPAPASQPTPVSDPNPVGPYDPITYAAFMRHKHFMDNAKNRNDDTANYGAGPMRTMAF